jgi:hypothetical protein
VGLYISPKELNWFDTVVAMILKSRKTQGWRKQVHFMPVFRFVDGLPCRSARPTINDSVILFAVMGIVV